VNSFVNVGLAERVTYALENCSCRGTQPLRFLVRSHSPFAISGYASANHQIERVGWKKIIPFNYGDVDCAELPMSSLTTRRVSGASASLQICPTGCPA